jgi:MSHA biogenesis protein MshP
MNRRAFRHAPSRLQQGFSIVTAIFLLVVLAGLGAFLVTISATQHLSSALDVQGARAYQAARSGVEWGVYQALRNSSCAASTPLTLTGSLSGFSTSVQCSSAPYTEGGNTVTVYQITSTASYGTVVTSPDFVERQIQATVAK